MSRNIKLVFKDNEKGLGDKNNTAELVSKRLSSSMNRLIKGSLILSNLFCCPVLRVLSRICSPWDTMKKKKSLEMWNLWMIHLLGESCLVMIYQDSGDVFF